MRLNIGRTASDKFKSIVMYTVSFLMILGIVGFAAPQFFGQVAHATDNAITAVATDVTSTGATLNGTVGTSNADNTSFWWTDMTTPDWNVHENPVMADLGSAQYLNSDVGNTAGASYYHTLSGLTPSTLYHFVTFNQVGGIWYPGEILTFTTANGPVFIDHNVNGVLDSGEQSFYTIQAAISAATAGDTINVAAGTYTEVGQIIINKNLTIVGADKATTIIKPAQDTLSTDTDSGGNNRGWFLVGTAGGVTFDMSGVTLDGSGKNVCFGIYDYALGTIQDINVKNISCSKYGGRGIYLKNNATVHNVRLENIGRIGVFIWQGATAAIVDEITYIGKGAGDYLDYGIELENGAIATLSNNNISGNRGAANDGSTSAGILVTTYFGPGTTATITGNTLTDNTDGIAVGFDGSDTSVVTAHNNNLSGNIEHGVISKAPSVNAANNWWGSATGPGDVGPGTGDKVSTNVNYKPWCTDLGCTTSSSANPTTEAASGETTTAATVNGTNGDYDASNTSFWWGTSSAGSFTSATDPSGQLPSDWIHAPIGTGAQSADASFKYAITGLTPGTTYHFVAWSLVGGIWYPGAAVLTFTTISPDTTAPAIPTLVSPANGVYVKPAGLILDWLGVTDPSNPVTYDYQSALSPDVGAWPTTSREEPDMQERVGRPGQLQWSRNPRYRGSQ